MSEDPYDGATKITASKGGGASKWLIGAAAAVVLVGGAYAAWQTFSPAQDQDQYAINNEYEDSDALRAEPLEDEYGPAPETATASSDATPAPARRSTSQAASVEASAVPETTIGITPASASADEYFDQSESVVVRARPRPVWSSVPTAQRLSALYPARALEREREGEARLACIVESSGGLDCENVEQTPGFGGAALRVANTLRHSPYRADGSSAIGTPVNLRIVFRMEEETRRG